MKINHLLVMMLLAMIAPLALNAQTRNFKKKVSRTPRTELQFEEEGQLATIGNFQPGKDYHNATPNTRDNVLYYNGFNSQADLSGITFYDADGDGRNWAWWFSEPYGNNSFYSQSADFDAGALHPDNWLIMPPVRLPAGDAQYSATIYAQSYGAHGETMGIFVSPEGDDNIYQAGSDFRLTTGEYELCQVDISDYAGQTIQIVIRHYNCTNGWYLYVDDFSIYEEGTTEPLCPPEDRCELTFQLTDSWGDGWNGAYISVVDVATGIELTRITADDHGGGNNPSTDTKTMTVCDGRAINFVWKSGSDDHECSYVVYDINDEVILQGSAGNGMVTNYTASCSTVCSKPSDLTASDITSSSAELSWTGNADYYNIQYREYRPATVILTAGDIWGDGSGYQMLLDADATMYGNIFDEEGNEYLISDYSDFEYSIPEGAQFDPYDSHIVVNNSVSIQIPAGTYDWGIFNPSPGLNARVYLVGNAGNIAGMQDDFVFEAGKTYEFVIFSLDYSQGDGVNLTITDNGVWTTVPGAVTSPYTLTDLDFETKYEWRVKGDECTNWSANANFTTLTPSFAKEIVGYGDGGGHYYLISSPIGDINPENVENMRINSYDLYYFDQSQELEWINYKPVEGVEPNFDLLEAGKGYLYANSGDVTLIFYGKPYTGTGTFNLAYDADAHFPGWNLVGNPFNEAVTIAGEFYVMNEEGTEIVTGNGNIAPMEGVFVVATEEGQTVTFSPADIQALAESESAHAVDHSKINCFSACSV